VKRHGWVPPNTRSSDKFHGVCGSRRSVMRRQFSSGRPVRLSNTPSRRSPRCVCSLRRAMPRRWTSPHRPYNLSSMPPLLQGGRSPRMLATLTTRHSTTTSRRTCSRKTRGSECRGTFILQTLRDKPAPLLGHRSSAYVTSTVARSARPSTVSPCIGRARSYGRPRRENANRTTAPWSL
jgi:hypothetical protein